MQREAVFQVRPPLAAKTPRFGQPCKMAGATRDKTMKTKQEFSAFLALLVAAFFGVSAVRAQDAPPQSDNGAYANQDNNQSYGTPYNGQDPPSRVARMSYIEGSVSFQPGGQGDWGAAARNRPVTVGDKIWADQNSRAELQAGQANIHLAGMTALSFLNLDDRTTQMRLAEGSLNFRVRELRAGDVYEVDTPNVAFTVTQAGAFRVDVNENGDGTRVTVIRGEGQVTANGQTYPVRAGERGEFDGTEDVKYSVSAAPAQDGFDRWSNSRDLKEDNSVSARYVSRDMPGYDDLDDYGTWDEVPEYGHVWYPTTVDVGWAPYSYGYWNWVGPWGWTWVGDEPWGFAPYHYGRWAYVGGRWGWCPGAYYSYPVYGPAFVGFVGGGSWGLGFGFGWGGGIGWFPLGWGEPYYPWYGCSRTYIRNVNINNTFIHNTTIINNINNVNTVNQANHFNYMYAHNSRAVTVANRSTFVNGQAVNRGGFHVTDAALRGAQVNTRAGFSPTHQSFLGNAGAGSHIARPSAAVQNRPVMARTAPAAAASSMPVRRFAGSANASARGNVSSTVGASSNRAPAMGRAAETNAAANRGGFNNNRAPVMGRAAETNAAANNNRPSSAQNSRPSFTRNNPSGNNSPMSARQRELTQDKPPSQTRTAPSASGTRSWSAQGSTTDHGRAPAGFGANAPSGNSRSNVMERSDRPPASYNRANSNSGYSVSPRSSANESRPSYSNPAPAPNRGNNRSYEPPQRNSGYSNHPADRPSYNSAPNRSNSQPRYDVPSHRMYPSPSSSEPRGYSAPRSYSAPSRSYSPPSRSYSAPSYSAPSHSYSAPSHSYSAPSHSYSGGGGGGNSYHGGGGSGGAGSSHGGGGGGGSRGGSPHHG